jgi:hypothetical protein
MVYKYYLAYKLIEDAAKNATIDAAKTWPATVVRTQPAKLH